MRIVAAIVLTLVVAVAWVAVPPYLADKRPSELPANVVVIRLPLSNATLIKGERAILVDVGGPNDTEALVAALAENGVSPKDLSLILLTHGHADHAGGAKKLRELSGAPIAIGAPDAVMAKQGRNDDLKPTGMMARILKSTVDFPYPPFEPDIRIDAVLDLQPFGVEGQARVMPGHTPGSLVVKLPNNVIVAGDIMLGGIMGGAFFLGSVGPHYYQADLAKNDANIVALLHEGAQTFYLGHGGPVSREAVETAYGD
jgi:glyoxylase-like metal-dependent hydrolase (beta-lactamase superfamily II)